MRVDEVLDIIRQMCGPNGYNKNGAKIKIDKDIKITLSITTDKISVLLDPNPTVQFEKDFGFIKPQIIKNVYGLSFTDKEVTLLLKNFPDFSFNYS